MPKREVIRRQFILQTKLKERVKITHFNSRNQYIDLDNEYDHSTFWSKGKMYIQGQLMRLQLWTPTFNPEEETPLVPEWVSLPKLPWYCYCLEVVVPLLSPIGKVLFIDLETYKKTRDSMAKVKLQINLTKPRPQHVWLGYDEDEHCKGRWQTILYEEITEYYSYCKHQGHVARSCIVKEKDEDARKKLVKDTQ
ncbi:hypothetical protein P3L10_030776 [Capsicum annuum]